jgi:hypothetical protein
MNELDREAIRGSLMSRAGNAPDASAVAEATLNIYHQISALLAPIIGVRGLGAIFSRSLHLTSKAFPWLLIAGDNGDNAALLAIFKDRLAGSETNDAIEASYALLVTFTELMSAMIGESLTRLLLRPVWALPSQKIDQETKS